MGKKSHAVLWVPANACPLFVWHGDDLAQARNITGVDFACDGGIMAMGSWDQRVGLDYLGTRK